MASVDRAPDSGPEGGLLAPYRALLIGVAMAFVALVAQLATQGRMSGACVALTLAALVVAGGGLAVGLKRCREGLPAVGLWGLAAVTCVLGHVAVGPAWDSFALLLTAGAVAAGAAAALCALPTHWRRFAISLAIAAHFAAIATAVVMVPPRDGQAPWLAQQAWMRLARPYLLFTNLNNGYHFYAPDPGPTALLWFRLQYADGSSRWVRMPDHDACANHVERRRWGALATAVSQTVPSQAEHFENLFKKRAKREDIPLGPMPPPMQYREPNLQAKMLLASFARYVAQNTPHPLDESHPVTGVKVYRVEYHNPPAEHFHAGRPPLDPTLYLAFYQGEFDASGQLKPESMKLTYNARGELIHREQDPLLYWLIPIVRIIDEAAQPAGPERSRTGIDLWSQEGKIINYVRIHAGDPDEESVP